MFNFTITPDGGKPFDVASSSRDICVWEAVSTGRSLTALMENLRMSDLYEIAHVACRRLKAYDAPLAQFKLDCELEFSEADVDPTSAAA